MDQVGKVRCFVGLARATRAGYFPRRRQSVIILGMRSLWHVVIAATVLLGGCPSHDEPTTKLGDETVRAESAHGQTDEFGLPLVIVFAPPEVPKEIQGPSPPIKETPKAAPKKSVFGPFHL
jgi:hypothetical protein